MSDGNEKLTRQGVRDLGGNNQRKHNVCQHWYGPEHPIGKELWTSDYDGVYRYVTVSGRTCVYCGKVKRVDE